MDTLRKLNEAIEKWFQGNQKRKEDPNGDWGELAAKEAQDLKKNLHNYDNFFL